MQKTLLIIAPLLLLGSCGADHSQQTKLEHSGTTMGTSYSVTIVTPPSKRNLEDLPQEVGETLSRIDGLLSTYDADSELSKFNDAATTEWFAASPELCHSIDSSLQISALTSGAFDITVGPLVNLWGFGPDGSITEPPSDLSISAARTRVGFRNLHANCAEPAVRKDRADVYVDLSAYAKGYAVDQVAELLQQHGISNYLVEVGGELRVSGTNGSGDNWKIAIENPLHDRRTIKTLVYLSRGAIATSGDYRNFFEHLGVRYSHAIDSRTGRPIAHKATAVTVFADEAAAADAMATALLVMGPAEGLDFAAGQGLAAYFQIRNGEEFEYLATPAFQELLIEK